MSTSWELPDAGEDVWTDDVWTDDFWGAGAPQVWGAVPMAGRGSLPFSLLHGESLVAVASWALGEAGVRLCHHDTSWAEVVEAGAALVLHDPLCPGTPVAFLRRCVRAATDPDRPAVVAGTRPVTDTVRPLHPDRTLGETVDRGGLLALVSPVVLPAPVLAGLAGNDGAGWSGPAGLPGLPEVADLADLVAALPADQEVRWLPAPPQARRVVDASDLVLIEALG